MTKSKRSDVRDKGEDDLAPISERGQTAALRREVGRCARAAWDALQTTIASFARAKTETGEQVLHETGAACDRALSELDRLGHALRSLRAELGPAPRHALAPRGRARRAGDGPIDHALSRPPPA